jgi:redox-sensing transcriptional repressor
MTNRAIPGATVSRLPVYLRSLVDLPAGQETCSSEQLAAIAGVNSAQVRKDLSHLGSHGTRGVGYNVAELRSQLRRALGLTQNYSVVLIGAGNLGSALANYGGFDAWGFEIAAVVDADEAKIGLPLGGVHVEGLDALEEIVSNRGVSIAIIATPTQAAQEVADRVTRAGVRSILNFAPAVLQVPRDVKVRRVDLSTELQILTFHLSSETEGIA